MKTIISNENVAVDSEIESISFPSITLIFPIEKADTNSYQEAIKHKIEKALKGEYGTKANPVLEKLNSFLLKIRHDSSKKSVVIHLSPIYEKVFYLDVPLEEAIIIDKPFEIRDLVNSLYAIDKYLLLVQSGQHFKIFLCEGEHLMKIKVHIPDDITAYKNDMPEKIEYFSDIADRKEIMMDKFIHYIDKELDSILHKFNLPVFVMGAERMNGHFKKYTHHGKAIVAYIHGNYDEANPHELLHVMQPYLKELKDIEKNELRIKIEQAINADKFCFGIRDVWNKVMQKKGSLLLVEKNYSFPHIAHKESENNKEVPIVNQAFIKDAVDMIIEKVIECGGEVKFVDEDIVKDFQHIALCLYY